MIAAKSHRKQLLLLLAVLLAAIWGASLYDIERNRRERLHDGEAATALQAHTFAEHTLSVIKRVDELLLHLRANWRGDFDAFSALVKSRQQDISDLTFQIAVIDESGYLAYSNLAPATERTYLGDREHFRAHGPESPDRLFVSRPVKGKVSGKWSIQFTRAIKFDGRFRGVLVASVNPETFAGFRSKLDLSEQALITMARGSGELMARHPGADAYYGMVLKGPYSRPDAPPAGNFIRLSQTDGSERVFGYYRLPQHDLLFFVGESTEHLLAPHTHYRQRMLAYASGISVLLIAFVLYLSGSLIQRARTQERLLQQSAKFQILLGNASDGIHMLDGDGLLVEANEAFLSMLGCDASAVGKLYVTDWSLTDREAIKARLADMIPRRAKSVFEGRYRRSDGALRDAEISACGIEIDGKGYLYAAARDITERKQAEQALNESRDRFRKVVEQSPLSMALVSADGTIDYINRKAIETFGYLPEDIPHMDRWWVQAYPDPAYRAEVVAQWSGLVQEALANGHEIGASEYRVTCKDGGVKTMSIFGVWVGEQVLVIFEDVTERRQAEEQIRHLAYFDALTQLPNRRLLLDRLGQALIASNRSSEYGALMILDLDNFKALNDTRGHDVGDSLLVEVARRIVASVRQEDTVSRLGGDEYVVMVEGMGADETAAARRAEMIAEKVRNALNRPYELAAAQPHHSTPSIGVTLFRSTELPIETLLKQADMALYQAKGAGRNTMRFFNPAMQAAIESRSRMEAALRHGLQHGEFRLYYQPQFDHRGSLTGAEALLRWLPAGQPPVSPAEFIPLAEETGLIVPLGLWVMQTACAQLRAWSADARARGLAISINVSARQFRQNDFVEQVFDALKHSGADPALLKLELTESVVLENVEEMIGRMRQVKALGVTFALDDFGTGFSSLSYLKQLPLDQVKIDQSFVRDITRDPNDAAIVRAIIAMAASLGLNVIAEGVETSEQLQFLKDNGCLHYQGYLFAKPLPIEQWGGLLER